MNFKLCGILVLLLFGIFLMQNKVYAEGKGGAVKGLAKVNGSPTRTFLDINKISTPFYNDGTSDIGQDGNSGFELPKGYTPKKTCVFQSGFLWGCKSPVPVSATDTASVGGSAYRTGLTAGRILSSGLPEDPDAANVRIYRVRKDIYPGMLGTVDLTQAAELEGLGAAAIRAQYLKDWSEWPVADGAPTWVDTLGEVTGVKMAVIPGVRGADQTIWYVANDLNATQCKYLAGAAPLGIELQVTVWAYNESGALGNMIFRKYKLINKSTSNLEKMYVSQFSDIDDGTATDDYSGCDTTLSLGYCYNSQAADQVYSPLPPPAVGFDFFQGPKVPGVAGQDLNKNGVDDAVDYAIVNSQKVGPGFINLPMTAFIYFANGDANVKDPEQGTIAGSTQWYNFFQGKVGLTGNLFVDPKTGLSTPFVLTGDPQKGTGWLDGQVLAAGDRRIALASGPFTLAAGDTQEVIVAEIAAGAMTGVDRLSAIGLLKYYDQKAQKLYDNNFINFGTPPKPVVTHTDLDKEIVLHWDLDTAAVSATENFNDHNYLFQGYNVYQLPTSSSALSDGKLIATYDVMDTIGRIKDDYFDINTGGVENGTLQFGNNSGLIRYFDVAKDYINQVPLRNGTKYYFAVTAYAYFPLADLDKQKESSPVIWTCIPHSINPGVVMNSQANQVISNASHVGTGDATVEYAVVDPTLTTGATYTVGFHTQPDSLTGAWDDYADAGSGGEVIVNVGGVLNEAGNQFDYKIVINGTDGLSGPITSAGFWSGSASAPSLTPSLVVKGTRATSSGSWAISAADKDSLVHELTAFVITTAKYPSGEIAVPVTIVTYPWYLDRGTTRLLKYQRNLSTDDKYAYMTPATDGFRMKLGDMTFTSPNTFYATELVKQAVPTEANPIGAWADGLVFGDATGKGADFYGGGGSCTATDFIQDIELRFTGVAKDYTGKDKNDTVCTSGGSWASMRSRSSASAQALVRIPFEVWEVERNRQINCVITERNLDAASPWGNTGTPLWYRVAGRDYIEFIASPYDSTTLKLRTDPYITWTCILDDGEAHGAVGSLAAVSAHPVTTWHTGDVLRIKYANPIIPGSDVYTFTTPSVSTYSKAKAKEDVKNINVFPNPYYGVNSEELTKYERFVTFSHLPSSAKIRIFNLAGVLVKTVNHNDASSQFAKWNLDNENGLPVASGLYIAYIDMPDLGVTKTLKVAIIQEQQILDHF